MNSAPQGLNPSMNSLCHHVIHLFVSPTQTQNPNMINTVSADVLAGYSCSRHSADYILAKQDFLQSIV